MLEELEPGLLHPDQPQHGALELQYGGLVLEELEPGLPHPDQPQQVLLISLQKKNSFRNTNQCGHSCVNFIELSSSHRSSILIIEVLYSSNMQENSRVEEQLVSDPS